MTTPLSDEIRALIAYANETTEAGDTKLGDCVKTLVNGYNGGSNVPSSPFVIPQGALSSRLASLLAYANETTGAGDTLVGDAIRTLCEGYGQGGDLVFYERLRTDRVAYIDTGIIITSDNYITINFGEITTAGTTSYHLFGASSDVPEKRIQYAYSGGRNYSSFLSSERLINSAPLKSECEFTNGWYRDNQYILRINGANVGDFTITEQYQRQAERTFILFANRTNDGNGINANRRTCEIKRFRLFNKFDDAVLADFVPCTYNGEPGMWDLVSETFYGNAASSGQFSVEGQLGNPAETPFTYDCTWPVYGSNVASRMFDGNEATYGWFGGSAVGTYCLVAFERRCFINEIRVLHGRDSTDGIGIYLSDDGESWKLAGELQPVKNDDVSYVIRDAAKYVKFERISGTSKWIAIREFYFN